MGPETLSELLVFAKEVLGPSIPLFLLTALGWGVFSHPCPRVISHSEKNNKTKGQNHYGHDKDELIPLGPMAEAQKKRAEKLARSKGKAAGKIAMTEKLVRQANNNPIKPQPNHNKGRRH